MIYEELRPELETMLQAIAQRSMYSGNKIPDSVMSKFEIEVTRENAGVLVPFWISVLEQGRGVRKSNKDHGLTDIILKWMRKRGMLKAKTQKGQYWEARRLTWHINKYGNKQFNFGNPIFKDIYTTERQKCIERIDKKVSFFIDKITMEVL